MRFHPLTEEQRQAYFEQALDRAIRFGDATMASDQGLGILTWDAIAAVAVQYPNPTVEAIQAARDEFDEYA